MTSKPERTIVSAQHHSDRVYHTRDFKLHTEPVDSGYRQLRHLPSRPRRSEPHPISQSERDWAHVKSALAGGVDPEQLISHLAKSRANDKSDLQYYARLTVTKALADLRIRNTVSGSASVPFGEEDREAPH